MIISPTNMIGNKSENQKNDIESNLATVADPIYHESIYISETYEDEEKRIRENSKFGNLKTWRLAKIIIKCGDDLR